MVTAIVLAGGTGTRLGGNIPKQYLMVGEKPVIGYCLETFENNLNIDHILIVCSEQWEDYISDWIKRLGIRKFCGFASGGKSRQHSIYSALLKIRQLKVETDIVLIHDAARPLVEDRIIEECVSAAREVDGAMPVLPVKDTIYLSRTGQIDGLLCRDELFAGQAPESFRYETYLQLHEQISDEEMEGIRGSSELAYKGGMNIRLVEGAENNYKITTQEDLEKFRLEIEKEGRLI